MSPSMKTTVVLAGTKASFDHYRKSRPAPERPYLVWASSGERIKKHSRGYNVVILQDFWDHPEADAIFLIAQQRRNYRLKGVRN